jgi:hypothetical protein
MIRFWSKSILRVDTIYKINISNSQQSIKIDKITINMCFKSIINEPKTILYPLIATKLITNQNPTVCKAKKSIALLKLRKGMLTSTKVTLRKETPLIQVIDKPILPLEKEKVGKLKSLILGGFLAGFLTVLYLVFGRLYKKLVE